MSARQRKYHFLRSEVLPASNYPLPEPELAGEEPRASGYPEALPKVYEISVSSIYSTYMYIYIYM